MKLGHKVLTTLLILALITFISLIVAIISLSKLDSTFEVFINKDVVFLSNSKNIYSLGLQRGQAVRNIILNPDDEKAKKNFEKAADDSTKLLKTLLPISKFFKMENSISEIAKLTTDDIDIQNVIINTVYLDKYTAIKTLTKKETPLWREIKNKYFELEKDIFSKFENKEKQIKSEIILYKTIIIFLSLILIVILGFIYFIFNKIIVSPVQKIMKSIERDSSGNIRINEIKINSKDEIGDLATTINDLTSQVRTFVQSVRQSTEELYSNFKELNEAADQTSQGSQQVALSTEQLASGTQNASQLTDEGVVNVGNLNNNIQNLSEQSNEIIEIGNKTENNANVGKEQVKNAVSKITSIRNVSDEAANVVISLGSLSSEIAQIVDIIKGISSQTNLLALNAAIEAARAGEHGKGFAVVADEVKTLATQSGAATEKITEMIKEIQEKTHIAVNAMQKASGEVEGGVSVINEVEAALENIINQVKQTNLKISDNVDQIESIANNSQQIVKVIENISAIIEETAASAEEISSIAEEQTASVEEISASTSSLSKVAENLKKQVSVFDI